MAAAVVTVAGTGTASAAADSRTAADAPECVPSADYGWLCAYERSSQTGANLGMAACGTHPISWRRVAPLDIKWCHPAPFRTSGRFRSSEHLSPYPTPSWRHQGLQWRHCGAMMASWTSPRMSTPSAANSRWPPKPVATKPASWPSRLTAPLESATRLTMLNVLSAAMDEITRELAPGSVDVRLRGLDPDFVVTLPPTDDGAPEEPAAPAEPLRAPAPADGDEGGTARVNLRLPAHLKARAEEAATREGLSVNAWLVRAVSAAVDGGTRPRTTEKAQTVGQSFTGWVR